MTRGRVIGSVRTPRRFAVGLALLAVASSLAGCFGGDDPESRIATPTEVTVYPPVPTLPARDLPQFNVSDPGLSHTAPWREGDAWEWESNESARQYRSLHVVDEQRVGNRSLFLVEETIGRVGQHARARVQQWVDGGSWSILNSTDETGSTIYFEPPRPLRFFRNATFAYNETGTDLLTGDLLHNEWFVFSFLEANWTVVRLSWGQVATARVVHETFRSDGARSLVTWFVAPDYGQPVRYEVDDVAWFMTGVREGARQLGALR